MSKEKKITKLAVAFDATQVAPQQGMDPIPAGWYKAFIADGEVVPSGKDPTKGNTRAALEFKVVDGDYKGRVVFEGLNIKHDNDVAQRIAHEQLSAICHAVGVLRPNDLKQLFGKPLMIKVTVRPAEGEYEPRNSIRAFKPVDSAAGTVEAEDPEPEASAEAAPESAAEDPTLYPTDHLGLVARVVVGS